ncbi:VIT1/CCC1 transporter family protein [Pontibacter vulgaris]|uniref:VIT1/CCC1 transporter family protein n=1 Tax=Pontibacter vulgaris TaxID=2905679 RepID=UPI001FA733F8|nr:VIT1/CCC1 transporter family protein [Pontibacter vulgaris]
MAAIDSKAHKKYTDSLQTEVDAAFLYSRIAAAEEVPAIAKMFRELGEIEQEHVTKMTEKLLRDGIKITVPPPSWRARTLDRVGKILGYGYIIGVLMDTEKSITAAQLAQKEKNHIPVSGDEANHVKILQALLSSKSKVSGEHISRIEGKHRSIGGNALRAAVLGANDGLVSNMSLVMGVAGATDGQSGVLLAGMAGLLAGALSMALGEWISVKSSQELYERQMALEMLEIETNPEGEMRELALIYIAKGIPEAQAHQMAAAAIQDTEHAHEVLVKEELGINTEELKGSAWEAAITSFLLFAIGAILPVIPFFYTSGYMAIGQSLAFSTIGLFVIGAAITLFTGKSIWFSGFRQVLFGLAAAATTYVIGKLIGVSIAG